MVSEWRSKMNRSNAHHKPIPLFCSQSTQTQDSADSSETEDSDFPPCRIGNSPPLNSRSPLPPRPRSRYFRPAASGVSEEDHGGQSQRCQKPSTGLGKTNIVNIVDDVTLTATTVLHILYIPCV